MNIHFLEIFYLAYLEIEESSFIYINYKKKCRKYIAIYYDNKRLNINLIT